MRPTALPLVVASSLFLAACPKDQTLTRAEAEEALSSSNASSKSHSLTFDVVEISTHFTLGKAVNDAALELRDFAKSQIPCSTVSVDAGTVTIDFGTLEDSCTYRGHTYAGVVKLDLMPAQGTLKVHHTWQNLSNGEITVNGTADVTWSAEKHDRHVIYDMDWTDTSRNKGPLHAHGDVTQTLIDPAVGLEAGIRVDGERDWSLEDGRTWKLDIASVEMRGQDPVPQAGEYTLTTPKDKTITVEFARISPTKIRATITGPRGRRYTVDVVSIEP